MNPLTPKEISQDQQVIDLEIQLTKKKLEILSKKMKGREPSIDYATHLKQKLRLLDSNIH